MKPPFPCNISGLNKTQGVGQSVALASESEASTHEIKKGNHFKRGDMQKSKVKPHSQRGALGVTRANAPSIGHEVGKGHVQNAGE